MKENRQYYTEKIGKNNITNAEKRKNIEKAIGFAWSKSSDDKKLIYHKTACEELLKLHILDSKTLCIFEKKRKIFFQEIFFDMKNFPKNI